MAANYTYVAPIGLVPVPRPVPCGHGTVRLCRRYGSQEFRGKARPGSEEERISTTLDGIGDGVIAVDVQGLMTLIESRGGTSLRLERGPMLPRCRWKNCIAA